MTRRALLATGAVAASGAFAAGFDPVAINGGWSYPLSGSGNPRITVLGDVPPSPRPTVLALYANAIGSMYPLNNGISSTQFAALLPDWTRCCVDTPCHFGGDRFAGEPTNLDGWAHRYANGRTLWAPQAGQLGFLQRCSAGLDRLIDAGYVDAANLFVAGFSRGGLCAAHFAAYDPRVKGLLMFHPVTQLNLLSPWFDGHPCPEAAAVEDLVLLAPALAGKPAFLTVNTWDETVNTDAAISFARALMAAGGPTGATVPDVTLRVQTVAGHPSPMIAMEEARDWLLARV